MGAAGPKPRPQDFFGPGAFAGGPCWQPRCRCLLPTWGLAARAQRVLVSEARCSAGKERGCRHCLCPPTRPCTFHCKRLRKPSPALVCECGRAAANCRLLDVPVDPRKSWKVDQKTAAVRQASDASASLGPSGTIDACRIKSSFFGAYTCLVGPGAFSHRACVAAGAGSVEVEERQLVFRALPRLHHVLDLPCPTCPDFAQTQGRLTYFAEARGSGTPRTRKRAETAIAFDDASSATCSCGCRLIGGARRPC